MHLNRGCEGLASGQMSVRRALVASGIPTLAYEGNMGDRRDFNEAETLGRIEVFMGMLAGCLILIWGLLCLRHAVTMGDLNPRVS